MNDTEFFYESMIKVRDKIIKRRERKEREGDRRGYQDDSLILNGIALALEKFNSILRKK